MTPSRENVTQALPAFLTGFAAEARIARLSGWPVAIGGGTTEGVAQAARRLIEAGVSGIISFGFAGGLDPSLPAGKLIVADAVIDNGRRWPTDDALNQRLGGSTGHVCLGLDHIAATVEEKQSLYKATGAAAVDMESGAIAASGVPFAVLRAICDPADRALPPAALIALDTAGRIVPGRVLWSILTAPWQIGALARLARDAREARRTLQGMAEALAPFQSGE